MKGAKAVAYTRFSSENQREESIEAQLYAIEKYAAQKGIVILKTYKDEALTGTTDKRPGFQQMIKDAAIRDFSLVLVHKVNRFARNRIESALHKHALQKHGVRVIAVAEDFGQGHHAVLMESVLEGLAEFYSLELAAETMKGLMVNARKCKYNGGHVLYGYRVNEGKYYEVEPAEAAVVKDIFSKVAAGWSYIEILRYLEKKGIRNRRGKKFGRNSIHDMLRNERYTGTYIFNQNPRKHPITGRRTSRHKNPDSEIIRVPGGMPQIVPREQWEKIQQLMDKRKQDPTTARKRKFLLTGFITCGHCGSAYVGTTSRNKYSVRGYYSCTKRKNKLACNNKNIPQETMEKNVIADIIETIRSISVPKLTAALNIYYAKENEKHYEEKDRTKKELADVNKKINNLLDVIEVGGVSDIIKARLNENSERKIRLEAHLKKINLPTFQVTESIVRNIIKQLDPSGKSIEEQRAVFAKLGLEIIIYPDRIETILGEKEIVRIDTSSAPRHHDYAHYFAELVREEAKTYK